MAFLLGRKIGPGLGCGFLKLGTDALSSWHHRDTATLPYLAASVFLSRMDKEGLTRVSYPLMLPVARAIAGSKISRELNGRGQMG